MSEHEMLTALLDSCLDEPEPGDCVRGTDLADDILKSDWLAAHDAEVLWGAVSRVIEVWAYTDDDDAAIDPYLDAIKGVTK